MRDPTGYEPFVDRRRGYNMVEHVFLQRRIAGTRRLHRSVDQIECETAADLTILKNIHYIF
jgi:hypothetical protein